MQISLAHIDGVCWLCDLLLTGVPQGAMCIQVGERVLVQRPSIGIVQNAVAESGLIYCRKMLDFLGLKGRRNTGVLYERSGAYGDDTVGIEDLQLQRVPLAALVITPFGDASEVLAACEHTMRSADKGVAHFTEDRGESSNVGQIQMCARTVTWLTQAYVYKALGIPTTIPTPWTAG